MRSISPTFMEHLTHGYLRMLLDFIQKDDSLCLCIRENYINIYYRGGNLFRLLEAKDGYTGSFDSNYFNAIPSWLSITLPPAKIQNEEDIAKWLRLFPLLKQTIDFFFGTTSHKEEREFQQQILRDNNFGKQASSSDFYICDIEYSCSVGRFDMIGVQWPSTSSARKQKEGHRLVFIEVKSGDDALTGTAGLHRHIEDMNLFLSNMDDLESLKKEMVALFAQQHQLGLIKNTHVLNKFGTQPPLYLLLLINHDPASSILHRECTTLPTLHNAELAFIEANFMGFGLFEERLLKLERFLEKL